MQFRGISSAAQIIPYNRDTLSAYGALAKDERLFNFAFDRAAVTLSSIDKKGRLLARQYEAPLRHLIVVEPFRPCFKSLNWPNCKGRILIPYLIFN